MMATLDDYMTIDVKERMARAGYRRIKTLDVKTAHIDLHVSNLHPAVDIFTWETAKGTEKALAYVRVNGKTSILPVMEESA